MDDFAKRSGELYRKRVGVSYMLPSGSGGMEQFYQQVIRGLRAHLAKERAIDVNSNEDAVLRALIGAETWPDAFRISVEQSPENAVSFLRERVKTEVKKFLRSASPGEQPILPRLHDLLIEAAGHGRGIGPTIDPDYVDGFRGKLAGLLPANFTPQGSGQMKVLITYPADAESEVVKNYLKSSVALPKGPRVTEDFRHTRDRVDLGRPLPHRDGRHRGRRGPRRAAAVGGRARRPAADRPAALAAADRLRLRLPGHARAPPGRDPAPDPVRAVERPGRRSSVPRRHRSGSTCGWAGA